MKFLCSFLALSITTSLFAIEPYSTRVKVDAVWISTNADCTNPITVFNSTDSYYLDFLGGPRLGEMDNTAGRSNGTYKCVIAKMNEAIRFTPKTTVGYCTAGTEYVERVCGSGVTTVHPETLEVSTCSGSTDTDDTIYVYYSTQATAASFTTSGNPFRPPSATHLDYGINLSAPWVVAGPFKAKFVVNTNTHIVSQNTTCVLDSPVVGFSEIPL